VFDLHSMQSILFVQQNAGPVKYRLYSYNFIYLTIRWPEIRILDRLSIYSLSPPLTGHHGGANIIKQPFKDKYNLYYII